MNNQKLRTVLLDMWSVQEVQEYFLFKVGIAVISPTSVIHPALQLCCVINNKFCPVFHGRWLQIESQHVTE